MGRTVISKADVAKTLDNRRNYALEGAVAAAPALAGQSADEYRDRLMKYIPTEVVAIYLALVGLLKTVDPAKAPIQTVGWIIFAIILAVSIPWQRRIAKITKGSQVIIGALAFVFWAISLGEPFASTWKSWYQPAYGAMALALYTFLIPLLEV